MRRDPSNGTGGGINGETPSVTSFPTPARRRTRPLLVLGGAGFIGSNLVDRLAREGRPVLVFDALSRPGVDRNLWRLKAAHPRLVSAVIADVRDAAAVAEAVGDCAGVFHLAAQVAVTTSLDDPVDDFDINARGTLNVLEALRRGKRRKPLLFASTNKVYGNLADLAVELNGEAYAPCDLEIARHGVAEDRPLHFHTPYGCSKGAADQYVLDFARTYGVPAAVLRMSCIYGPHQFGTEDQGWVAHFLLSAMAGKPITVYGDGCQVRDILYVDDAVSAYIAAWRNIDAVRGRAFNLGGGPANAVSLRQVLQSIEELSDRPVAVDYADWRPGDQRFYVSDTRRVTRALGLAAPLPWRTGIARLADWLGEPSAAPALEAASNDVPREVTR
ncbi:MAG: NAD-dependent epimerase/dehydratase family protein [Hyphomicrobiales bacterium]